MVQASGFSVQGTVYAWQIPMMSNSDVWESMVGPQVLSGLTVQGAGFRVQGPGSRVQGEGFRVKGSG